MKLFQMIKKWHFEIFRPVAMLCFMIQEVDESFLKLFLYIQVIFIW